MLKNSRYSTVAFFESRKVILVGKSLGGELMENMNVLYFQLKYLFNFKRKAKEGVDGRS